MTWIIVFFSVCFIYFGVTRMIDARLELSRNERRRLKLHIKELELENNMGDDDDER